MILHEPPQNALREIAGATMLAILIVAQTRLGTQGLSSVLGNRHVGSYDPGRM
jgi:hypothetical protein